jgi:C1A family cysteine protease
MYSAGEPLQDSGAHFRALFDQAMNFGVLAESDCPWEPGHVNDDPGFDALVNGQTSLLRANNWHTVDSDGDARHQEVRAALSAGHGVGGAWAVKKGFTRCASAFYDLAADGSAFAGNHAMALVGYDEDRYLLQNSWGNEFGLDGYVWVPLRFVEEAFDLSVVTLLSVDTSHVLRYDVRHDRDPDLLPRRPRLRVPPPEPPRRGLPGA